MLIMAVEEFDGRDRSQLEQAVLEPISDQEKAYLAETCHAGDRRRGRAAMWCIRELLEKKKGQGIDMTQVFELFAKEVHWTVLYQLLMSVQFAPEPALPHAEAIRSHLDAKQTAIRVGALDALVHLAIADDRYLPEAQARLMAGLDDAMPSIRARSRNLAKTLNRKTKAK